MNRHKLWFYAFSAFSMAHSLAGLVFLGLAVYFTIQKQAGISMAMVGFTLLGVLGAIGYRQWAEYERVKYF